MGHIVLEHLIIPRSAKSQYELAIEEEEAHEFAGRFLMPEKLLLSSNFISREAVSQHFIVSNQAVWKRLNNLKRLDILNSTPKQVCGWCGNDCISPIAYFCHICGQSVYLHQNGITVIDYSAAIKTDNNLRVLKCLKCENEEFSDEAFYCRICGMSLYNLCIGSSFNDCFHINPANARFCEDCGKHTIFFIKELLSPWDLARDKFLETLITDDTLAY